MTQPPGYQAPDKTGRSARPVAARPAGAGLASNQILALQRAVGNASVSRLMVQRQSLGGTGGTGGSGGPGFTSTSSTETLTGFATGSSDLTPEHQATLDGIAADLTASPLVFGGYVTLVGSADRRGDAGDNQSLGQRRADAVRDYLQGQITDDETRQQIRAYSLGAPGEGPVADDPSLRKVEITITRRGYDLGLPGLTPPGAGTPDAPAPAPPDIWHLPPQPIPDPGTPQLPDWFWRQLPARPADPSFVSQLSAWLNRTLRTDDLAGIGGSIAGALGFDAAQVRQMLRDAFRSGGEDAVKALLNSVIRAVAGSPTSPPSSPYGPPVEPIPFPSPQLQLPPIRW